MSGCMSGVHLVGTRQGASSLQLEISPVEFPHGCSAAVAASQAEPAVVQARMRAGIVSQCTCVNPCAEEQGSCCPQAGLTRTPGSGRTAPS
jgi:hypothetical protein